MMMMMMIVVCLYTLFYCMIVEISHSVARRLSCFDLMNVSSDNQKRQKERKIKRSRYRDTIEKEGETRARLIIDL